ncbi:hypothetical protein [Niabella soli]|uniref:PH domain-containing protein n=1 Tax=Niabella soli DSM 19437 TaxID=929713 RepID=W0F373_9BACT|nr:hypothetical protein [Niabella soli]AHF17482.1 hypothetical protein NIASO_08430 [Niabella soli DSM 19437]
MIALTSKVQYKNYEPGEFAEIQQRTYEATLQLIKNYPWEKEHDHLVVDMTTPSVTLQDDNGSYLKLGLYYNHKFVLYYYDAGNDDLYLKSVVTLEESFPYVREYFNNPEQVPDGFKFENTWFKEKARHFATNDFCYTVDERRLRAFCFSFSNIVYFGFGLVLLFSLATHPIKGLHPLLAVLLLILLLSVMGGGIQILLLIKYYAIDKNKVLIFSKGKKTFYYGTENEQKEYLKQDIDAIEIKQSSNSGKNPIYDFAAYKIYMKDGTLLTFTSLLMPYLDFEQKVSGLPVKEKKRFPWPAAGTIPAT